MQPAGWRASAPGAARPPNKMDGHVVEKFKLGKAAGPKVANTFPSEPVQV